VTDQKREGAAPARECFQDGEHVSDHVLGPVAAAGGRVEAGGLAVPASVWRDDAVVVTPAANRVRPAQTRVGETVQQHQGWATIAPELTNHQAIR